MFFISGFKNSLCHVYAKATRSVSIPTPQAVYCEFKHNPYLEFQSDLL